MADGVRILVPDLVLHVLDDLEDRAHGLFQIVLIAVLAGDDPFPVPLVDIAGMQVVENLIPADGVHVRIEALMDLEAVFLQRIALPLGQRLHDFDALVRHIHQIKGDRSLDAVQVVVQAAFLFHEQRGADAGQMQLLADLLLEGVADILDGLLGLADVQGRFIVLRQSQIHGEYLSLC